LSVAASVQIDQGVPLPLFFSAHNGQNYKYKKGAAAGWRGVWIASWLDCSYKQNVYCLLLLGLRRDLKFDTKENEKSNVEFAFVY
jgi:hypothetical protein